MDELRGKTAVVTGAASGMGRAFAERFAKAGMNIVLADIEAPRLEDATAAVRATGVDALAVATDVSDAASVDALRDAAIERFGRVHVVCNNAGVGGSMSGDGSIHLPEWRWVIGVNMWGVIHGHRAFLPHLIENGEGHIVNTASMAGHFPGNSPYSVSKWAVVAMSEGLYHQLQREAPGVGISCLCPGWVNTDIMKSERNRPDWAEPKPMAEPLPMFEVMREFVNEQLRSGMAPARVADLVHDAVLGNKFWVFTDMDMVAGLADRYDAVLKAENPPPMIGLGLPLD